MSKLSWGKCKIEVAASNSGVPGNDFTEIDTPKLDSTQLNTEDGDEVTAQEEGGEVVDARYGKASYTLEWDNFVKKGVRPPFEDTDGIIPGEHALKVTPEDASCVGIQIDRCVIRSTISYTSADGILIHYTAKVLKPAEGKMVKFTNAPGSLTLSKTALYFGSAADTTGKTVTATATGTVTATSSESWCTATVSSQTVTIKVTANSASEPRVASVTISADGKSSVVKVTQIPA